MRIWPAGLGGGIVLELTAVALVDSWFLSFTENEKLVHRVCKRDIDVPREDLTHFQGQWTRQVLSFHGSESEGNRKAFYDFINTRKSFLKVLRPQQRVPRKSS